MIILIILLTVETFSYHYILNLDTDTIFIISSPYATRTELKKIISLTIRVHRVIIKLVLEILLKISYVLFCGIGERVDLF